MRRVKFRHLHSNQCAKLVQLIIINMSNPPIRADGQPNKIHDAFGMVGSNFGTSYDDICAGECKNPNGYGTSIQAPCEVKK